MRKFRTGDIVKINSWPYSNTIALIIERSGRDYGIATEDGGGAWWFNRGDMELLHKTNEELDSIAADMLDDVDNSKKIRKLFKEAKKHLISS